MRLVLPVATMVAVLAPHPAAHSRLNPLRQMGGSGVRPEIVIVFDTSGSMMMPPEATSSNSAYRSGSDCGGDRAGTVDLCGDGLCSGLETSGTCPKDCDTDHSQQACKNSWHARSKMVSRMFLTKRVLRNILPQIRTVANVGLVSFQQSGYFHYYKATTGTPEKVAIFLSKREMEVLGFWDSGAGAPKVTHTWPGSGQSYTLLSDPGVQGGDIDKDADSLYARSDDTSVEHRWTWAGHGTSHSYGGFTWDYVGSYYVYERKPYTSTDLTSPTYKGPQFFDGTDWWVYRAYKYEGGWMNDQDISSSPDGLLLEQLEATQTQTSQDAVYHRVLARMNKATNGGFLSVGSTPSGHAIAVAHQHFKDRHDGTGPFSGFGQDPDRACRKRFVLFLTDGEVNCAGASPCPDPWDSAADLYNDTTFAGNEIQTLAVGLPGLPSGFASTITNTHDAGDDGVINGSCDGTLMSPPDPSKNCGYLPTNEQQLAKDLLKLFKEVTAGDFVTSAASVASSETGSVTGDLALVPSFEYPGWKGHLKAWDLTQDPAVLEWDLATELPLSGTPWTGARSIYTAFPDQDNHAGLQGGPLPLLDGTGFPADGTGDRLRAIWKAAIPGSTYPDGDLAAGADTDGNGIDDLVDFLRWLYTTELQPIIRSVPAVVGAPPSRSVQDHATFESTHSKRPTLVYVTSNIGMIHAVRAGLKSEGGGAEEFAFVPPGVLDQAYELYKHWKTAGQTQDDDPAKLRWVLASSPRVSDVYTGTPKAWRTQMVVTYGPYQHGMITLDVTEPLTGCTPGPCTVNETYPWAVFTIYDDAGTANYATASTNSSMPSGFGESWSIPALFWTVSGDEAQCKAGTGSGYGAPTSADNFVSETQGHYYTYIGDDTWDTPSQVLHDPTTVKVDYAVLADTVAAVDETDKRAVIATYQADLEGNLYRYDAGGTTRVSLFPAKDDGRPFYYSPAALHLGSKQVVLALNSGSADEDTPPSPDITSRLLVRTETNGAVDTTTYFLDCTVGSFGSCTVSGGSLDTSDLSTQDTDGDGENDLTELNNIPSTAKPVSPPMLLMNDPGTGQRVEVFWLLYDADASGGCAAVNGTSYLVRIAVEAGGTGFKVEEVTSVGNRVGGMTLAGGGTKIVMSRSAIGVGNFAAPDLGNKGPLDPGAALGSAPPRIESWREVR